MSQCFLLLVVGAASYVLLSGLPAVAQEDYMSKLMEDILKAIADNPHKPRSPTNQNGQPPPDVRQEPPFPHGPFNRNPDRDFSPANRPSNPFLPGDHPLQNRPPSPYNPGPPYGDPTYPNRQPPPGMRQQPHHPFNPNPFPNQNPPSPPYGPQPPYDNSPGDPAYPIRDQPPGEQFPPQYPPHPPPPPLSQEGPVEPPMNPMRPDHPSRNLPPRRSNPWNPYGRPRGPPYRRRRPPPRLWPRPQLPPYPPPPSPDRPFPPDNVQPDKQPVQPTPVTTYEATSEAPSSYVTPAPTVTSSESNATCSENMTRFTECVNPFNSCGAMCKGGMKDDFVKGWSVTAWCCRAGCDCQEGYKRNESGICIGASLCPKCPEDDSNKNHNLTESFSR